MKRTLLAAVALCGLCSVGAKDLSRLGEASAVVDFATYGATAAPNSVMLTFHEGPDTRGFTWQTDTSVTASEVWLLKASGKGVKDADEFTGKGTRYEGTCQTVKSPANTSSAYSSNLHKVTVAGLVDGTYSYRLGGAGKYVYGEFVVRTNPAKVMIVNLNDAQTKDLSKGFVWANTVNRAAKLLAGETVDMVVYGGDFYDMRAWAGNSGNRVREWYRQWGFGVDSVAGAFPGVPWSFSCGNHDCFIYRDCTDEHYSFETNYIFRHDWNQQEPVSAGAHAMDYGNLHLVTMPFLGEDYTGDVSNVYNAAFQWLDRHLRQVRAERKPRWIVVGFHWGPYTTGDHFMDANTKDLIRDLTPVLSRNHVDLVLQAHDHTFVKTLPYRWDAAGYTDTYDAARAAEVVNLEPEAETVNGERYYLNPEGTVYVSCGSAGHRVHEAPAYAKRDASVAKSYVNGAYKIVTDKLNIKSVVNGTTYNVGDDASQDPDASMFGVLRIEGDSLAYDFYAVATDGLSEPVHFDTLRILKRDEPRPEADAFRVTPYLQHPATDAMSVIWFTESNALATVKWWPADGAVQSAVSTPKLAAELGYSAQDRTEYNQRTGYSGIERGPIQSLPWRHRVRLTGLASGTRYTYAVELAGGVAYTNSFRTVPDRNSRVRFICYSDSETEPESTGKYESWEKPPNGSPFHPSAYFVDSTTGYASNIVQMIRRQPDFYLIAGDLVQYGEEQRDWDEFWRHNAGVRNDPAGSAPIFAAPGNHDYLGTAINGNQLAAYDGGEAAISKYLCYFEYPPNGVDFNDGGKDRSQLFYRQDYGRVTVIAIDTNNGDDSDMSRDTCLRFYRQDATLPPGHEPTASQGPCRAPDFNPGTPQFNWLTNQLADAQAKGQFTFVLNHHVPHSVGYHNRKNVWSTTSYQEPYSACAVRVLQPYLLKYGVTAWICGHDEIMERSVVNGTETCPDGKTRPAKLLIYDVGNSGDGLRGGGAAGEGYRGEANPYEAWRAHVDAPEVYDDRGVLVRGGKHYGHLEVNVKPMADGRWKCTLSPVHVFVNKVGGQPATFERRVYDDEVIVTDDRQGDGREWSCVIVK